MNQNQHRAVYGFWGVALMFTLKMSKNAKMVAKNNLEWAYRLIKQPLRIKRQIHLLRFYFCVQLNKF